MRQLTICLAAALALTAVARPARAQDSTRAAAPYGGLPTDVAAEAVRVYNAPATLRARGALTVDANYAGTGDVAVLNGPLTVAGHVAGRVVAINADVVLQPGARIDGDLLVVGGHVTGRAAASVGGDVRVYDATLSYREAGDRIDVAPGGAAASADDPSWWRRWSRTRERSRSSLRIASASTYNRVEGLPLQIGPIYRRDTNWGEVRVDALGIVRTVNRFEWTPDNLGHLARAEVRVGGHPGFAVGGRLYDVVQSVEPWQLGDAEVGLASFFLHRDYRDYFNTHGGAAYARVVGGTVSSLTVGLADERWASRTTNDPFTIFRNAQGWRPNPRMDEGRFHVATASFTFDTRNTPRRPWSGWFATADLEHGSGRAVRPAPAIASLGDLAGLPPADGTVRYDRAFVDVRRYNRLAPGAQLNLRGVLGGQLGRDALPLERRFSVGGPGTLPGYDFRGFNGPTDLLECAPTGARAQLAAAGMPALCQRIALAQAEYRGDLRFNIGLDDSDRAVRFWHDGGGSWVLLADAGRGWLVGERAAATGASARRGRAYGLGELPSLGTFRTDVGLGLDFTGLGLYVAKALSDAKEPANFVVRVRRRI